MVYMDSIEKGIRPAESENIDSRTHYDDIVMTALRTCEGLDLALLDEQHHQLILNSAAPYINEGMLEIRNGWLRLTRSGIVVSNMIMSDLMDV